MPRATREADSETLTVFGENVRAERVLRGWSMERLAQESNVSLDTIFRIEHANPSTMRIRKKVADALETTYRRLTLRSRSIGPGYAIHRHLDDRWVVLWDSRPFPAPEDEEERIQRLAERRRLGRLGFVQHFVQLMNCRLDRGKLVAGVIEVYGPGELSTYVAGEVFVTVLEGNVLVQYGEDRFELIAGEAATIRCGLEEFGFAPAEPEASPARLLYVRLDEATDPDT
ncbi:MAG: helix-turn-helix domain-containing protein [Fimbriimonadaceae bacterium]